MSTGKSFNIREGKSSDETKRKMWRLKAREMLGISRDHYVMARFSMFAGYPIVAGLLAHQSMEIYVKGLIKYDGAWVQEKMGKEHNVIALMKAARGIDFSDILNNPELRKFLQELFDFYTIMRFGEQTGSSLDTQRIAHNLDELAMRFEQMYLKRMKIDKVRLHVHDNVRAIFLQDNEYFTAEMISNTPLASWMPGLDSGRLIPSDAKKGITMRSFATAQTEN